MTLLCALALVAAVEYSDGSLWDERPIEPYVTWTSPNKGLTHRELIEKALELGATTEQIEAAIGHTHKQGRGND